MMDPRNLKDNKPYALSRQDVAQMLGGAEKSQAPAGALTDKSAFERLKAALLKPPEPKTTAESLRRDQRNVKISSAVPSAESGTKML